MQLEDEASQHDMMSSRRAANPAGPSREQLRTSDRRMQQHTLCQPSCRMCRGGFSIQGMHNTARLSELVELGTPNSRRPPAFQPTLAPAEPAQRFLHHACQQSPAWAGSCSTDVALCEGYSSGPAVCCCHQSRGVDNGLPGPRSRRHPQSTIFELGSCPGPELAGLRAQARQAAQR